jgi:broad specificity phosphatase PhoE
MIIKYFTIIVATLGLFSFSGAQTNDEVFTIYLVRHSEKETTTNDPPLTPCGIQRSKSLCSFLEDVKLEAIYSTDFVRTKSTALPTATSKGLEILEYNPDELQEFSRLLVERKQDALIVGHSNTTAVLAGLLIGEDLGEFALDIFDRIYQVVIYKNSGRLHILHSAFECK